MSERIEFYKSNYPASYGLDYIDSYTMYKMCAIAATNAVKVQTDTHGLVVFHLCDNCYTVELSNNKRIENLYKELTITPDINFGYGLRDFYDYLYPYIFNSSTLRRYSEAINKPIVENYNLSPEDLEELVNKSSNTTSLNKISDHDENLRDTLEFEIMTIITHLILRHKLDNNKVKAEYQKREKIGFVDDLLNSIKNKEF